MDLDRPQDALLALEVLHFVVMEATAALALVVLVLAGGFRTLYALIDRIQGRDGP